jgi:hypothetical protein
LIVSEDRFEKIEIVLIIVNEKGELVSTESSIDGNISERIKTEKWEHPTKKRRMNLYIIMKCL